MRGSAEDLAKFHLVENRDIYGGDIRELFGISIEACARQCLDNESCAIYSFDRWYNACFIKSRSKIAERFKLTGFPGSRRLNRHDQILKREPKSTIGIRKDLMDDVPGDDTRGRVTLVVRRGQ